MIRGTDEYGSEVKMEYEWRRGREEEYLSGEGDEIGNRSSCIATLIDRVFDPPTFVFNLFFPRRESFTVLSLRFDLD